MAKTRANVQSSKLARKSNGPKTPNVKKGSTKAAKLKCKAKDQFSAAKLQSQTEMKKTADLQATEELLKLCRPISISLTRVKETKPNEVSKVESELLLIFCIHFFHLSVFQHKF